MSSNQTRDALRQAVATATSFPEQQAAVAALDAFDQHQRTAAQTARDVDWADTVVQQTLQPVAVHERSTIETDWLGDFEADNSPQAHHAAIAEVAMWFGRTSPEVRADRDEFGTQAEGFVRRVASAYGEQAPAIQAEALTYLGFLYRQGASGLDQIQQTVNPHEDPKTTPLNPEVFDNFADEVHPINAGVVGTETSERNPLLQEIEQEGSGQGQAEVEGGHSTDNVAEGPPAPYAGTVADSGPLGTTSMAISHLYTLDDFRQREAASGLDQIQQVVDPHEDPKPTPLNTEVQFPWLIGPDAYGNGGEQKEGSQRAPFAREAADSDSRFDHPNYGLHYQHGYDSSGRYGDPITFRDSESDEDRYEWEGHDIHDLTRGEYEHQMDHPGADSNAQHSWMDGWLDRAAGRPHGTFQKTRGAHNEPGWKESVLKKQAGNPHPKGTPNWFEWEQNPDAEGHGPQSGVPKDLFPQGGVPLRGELTDEQQKWLKSRSSLQTRADMYGNSDADHAVVGPPVGNNPGTAPVPAGGYQQGYTDGQNADAPTVADASSSIPPKQKEYSKGYGDGAHAREGSPAKDFPVSEGGDNGTAAISAGASLRRSAAFVATTTRAEPDFVKGYAFASKWEPGKPLVTTGSLTFEEGLFAGLVDSPDNRDAWRAAHRRQAHKDEQFAQRMARHDAYVDYLAENGIDVIAKNTPFGTRDACSACGTDIEYVGHRPDKEKEFLKIDRGSGWWDRGGNFSCPRGGTHSRGKTAVTTTDLDTLAPNASPSATGETPINGPGKPPPLEGGVDPARPGGPSPYNGAEPLGAPAVPNGTPVATAGSQYVNDIPGGPLDGNTKGLAFRRTVQSSLLAQKKRN